MKPGNKAYLAATVGAAVEPQHQSAKSHTSALKRNLTAVGSSKTQVRILPCTSGGGQARDIRSRDAKRKAAEESLRMVVYLSCWGPN